MTSREPHDKADLQRRAQDLLDAAREAQEDLQPTRAGHLEQAAQHVLAAARVAVCARCAREGSSLNRLGRLDTAEPVCEQCRAYDRR